MGDIGDLQSATLFIETAVDGSAALNIMVNNAAVRSDLPTSEVDTIHWDRIAETCLKGSFNFPKLCTLLMIRQVGSVIIPLAGMSSY